MTAAEAKAVRVKTAISTPTSSMSLRVRTPCSPRAPKARTAASATRGFSATTLSGTASEHTYAEPGTYGVTLVVRDDGVAARVTKEVMVSGSEAL